MSSTGVPTPPAAAAGSTTGSTSEKKSQRILACVLCQHRKIKCDRNTPCSNCIKANVKCTPSTPAPARKRRRPNQDLQERLARCEDLLRSYASAASAETPAGPPTSASTDSPREATAPGFAEPPAWPAPGKVISEDGSTRFVDSVMWTTIHEELSAMRKIVDSDEPEDHSTVASEAATPDDDAGGDLLLGDYANLSIADAYPEPVHVFRLWQIFLERVNPLCKIIHVPSVQPHVVEAASGTWNVPPNYKPLLFAVFNMGVFALSDTECRQTLGMSRESALKKFSAGVRAALLEVNFMTSYDLCVLQALVLYLVSVQGCRDKHAAWVLSGVCVRIAQKMGLHRDGESLNLTPFETEMRRRLWWNLVIHDSGLAIMSGLSYSVISMNWTTKLPRNLNDAELFPGSTEPIHDREGPTEMGFSILMYTVWRFIIKWQRDHPGFEAAMLGYNLDTYRSKFGGLTNTSSTALEFPYDMYRELVDSFEVELNALLDRYIDPAAGPSHAVAWAIPGMLIQKLRDTLIPFTELPEYGTEVFSPSDNLFRLGVASLDNNTELFDLLERNGFLWHHKLHFQVEMFTAMVAQLVHRPKGSLSDRGWRGVDIMYRYHPELYDMSHKQNVTLRSFVMKAWKNRAVALAEQGQTAAPIPATVCELTKTFPEGRVPDVTTPMSTASSSGAREGSISASRQGSNRWGPAGAAPPTATFGGDLTFGGMLDMGAMDWDMFADSMTQERSNLSGLGYPLGGNIAPPW